MTRALLAFALAFSLGSPALQPMAEALYRLVTAQPTAVDAGSQWDPNGGSGSNVTSPSGSESDAGNHWDPNG
jgi:hypothetical protein